MQNDKILLFQSISHGMCFCMFECVRDVCAKICREQKSLFSSIVLLCSKQKKYTSIALCFMHEFVCVFNISMVCIFWCYFCFHRFAQFIKSMQFVRAFFFSFSYHFQFIFPTLEYFSSYLSLVCLYLKISLIMS